MRGAKNKTGAEKTDQRKKEKKTFISLSQK